MMEEKRHEKKTEYSNLISGNGSNDVDEWVRQGWWICVAGNRNEKCRWKVRADTDNYHCKTAGREHRKIW